ncbi:hypothetical protein Barb7_02276 [Bacteroidales bacterium Barb7]|nr:hypothetical protein Barb7_02276 [Bacteroidales bacterium Barb7]
MDLYIKQGGGTEEGNGADYIFRRSVRSFQGYLRLNHEYGDKNLADVSASYLPPM